MASRSKRKSWLKLGAVVAAGVVGWDLLKAHTGIARPKGRGVNQ